MAAARPAQHFGANNGCMTHPTPHEKSTAQQPLLPTTLEYTFDCELGQGVENHHAVGDLYCKLMTEFARLKCVRELAFRRKQAIVRCSHELNVDARTRLAAIFETFAEKANTMSC